MSNYKTYLTGHKVANTRPGTEGTPSPAQKGAFVDSITTQLKALQHAGDDMENYMPVQAILDSTLDFMGARGFLNECQITLLDPADTTRHYDLNNGVVQRTTFRMPSRWVKHTEKKNYKPFISVD